MTPLPLPQEDRDIIERALGRAYYRRKKFAADYAMQGNTTMRLASERAAGFLLYSHHRQFDTSSTDASLDRLRELQEAGHLFELEA